MRKIGIYPGTFNPIHLGHLSFSLESIRACELDSVVFLPEVSPRTKVNVISAKKRVKAIQEMIDPHPDLATQLLTSPRFTVIDTLPEIQNLYRDSHLTLLLGSDVALSLSRWDDVNDLFKICDVAIGMRSKQNETEIEHIISEARSQHPSVNFTIVKTNYPSLASSAFRKK